MNIRYDVANYYKSTDEEKDVFWMKEANCHYEDVQTECRIKMIHTSKLVENYINATEEEKLVLWRMYDDFTQLYCDNAKWHKKCQLQAALKSVS